MKLVYLAPKADFRPYTKVMVDPTEVAFDKNWIRDYSRDSRGTSGQLNSTGLGYAVTDGVKRASAIFEKAFTEGGYPVVTAPGPDVLRVRTALADVRVTSPEGLTMGRTFFAARNAGSATLVVEVRDSQTGAILGRAIDARTAGAYDNAVRNSVTNRRDFEQLVQTWAEASVAGLNELKTLAPAAATGPAG